MNLVDVELRSDGSGAVLEGAGLRIGVDERWLQRSGLRRGAAERYVLGVRPEHVELSAGDADANCRGRVFAVEPMGAEELMSIELETGAIIQARVPSHGMRPMAGASGDVVGFGMRADRLYLFDAAAGLTVAQADFTNQAAGSA
jgi:multiple sugar transport system ATP-binding protein